MTHRDPHGTRARYSSGCRCIPCRAANSRYEVDRLAARKLSDGTRYGLVPANKARHHLRILARAGIGRPLVSDISGVSQTAVQSVRSGKRKWIRPVTERALLAVDRKARSGNTLIPAERTWKLLEELIGEGFTEAELAKRLGYKLPVLRIGRFQVAAKTELKVERFHRTIMEGA